MTSFLLFHLTLFQIFNEKVNCVPKETLGIYGRVCGPATTTVQLFEEETCMMDDNATPAK